MMESIRTLAESVQKDHSAYIKAKAQKGEAEDDLLEELLAIVQPVLPAICSLESAGKSRYRAVRLPAGILLAEGGMFFGPTGVLLNFEQVLDEISVTDIATVLAASLAAQVGKRTNITETIRREARTIEAIVLALKSGGIK
jgi:hypothetical protein